MIQDEYIKFETAKLLKEKGFDVKCGYCYAFFGEDDIRVLELKHHISGLSLVEKRYPYVTQSVAMKWLREVHGLNVQPCIVRTIELKKAYNATIYNNNCEQIKSHFGENIFDGFISYEEACEAAIKYCLENLI
jgi:hypothetical protein